MLSEVKLEKKEEKDNACLSWYFNEREKFDNKKIIAVVIKPRIYVE